MLKNIFKEMFSFRINQQVGNLAYLSIIAAIPTIILSTSILSLFINILPISSSDYYDNLKKILESLSIRNITTSILVNLTCLNLLSSGIYAVLESFEESYGTPKKTYLIRKIYSFSLSIIFVFYISLVGYLSFLASGVILMPAIKIIIDFSLIFSFIILFYKLTTLQSFKSMYKGSFICTALLMVIFRFLSYIIYNFTRIYEYYGILAPIIVFILLIYYSCFSIYFGITCNNEIRKYSRIKSMTKENTIIGQDYNA